ncbi:bacteriocin UviB precursor [Clostridium tepidiprofundi DSM 19306]|uniref:Bacteriocin UviB n=1 Tax=Clostridium tepidiprofundi DSM 19306 TaxID=1121338 RepID=A0A151B2X1_9CLOT|nr:BhlA/UviB family holin-like peptide [Clostridium tepidiprofundi]KYH34264.1 bacteriocin UviB precursor [Clostridium tepidiprofundi DSM 19306]
MGNEIIKLAATQGVWAALSVALIFYILNAQEKRDLRQEKREKNYQNIIFQLTDKFNILEDVKDNIEELKVHILKREK